MEPQLFDSFPAENYIECLEFFSGRHVSGFGSNYRHQEAIMVLLNILQVNIAHKVGNYEGVIT